MCRVRCDRPSLAGRVSVRGPFTDSTNLGSMRFLFAALLWLLTTAALAVTIAAAWAQSRLVDENGYAALTAPAAADPRVQHAIAGELTTQIVSLGKKQGSRVDESQVAELVAS